MVDKDSDAGQETDKKEEDKCWSAFEAFDRDNSGRMIASDLKFALEHYGEKVTEDECFQMISEADPENTGILQYS